jgi:hypothetical protein
MVSKRGKRRLVVAAARRLAIDLWRWATGRATAQELGLQFRLTGRLILHVSGGKRSKKGSTAKDLRVARSSLASAKRKTNENDEEIGKNTSGALQRRLHRNENRS